MSSIKDALKQAQQIQPTIDLNLSDIRMILTCGFDDQTASFIDKKNLLMITAQLVIETAVLCVENIQSCDDHIDFLHIYNCDLYRKMIDIRPAHRTALTYYRALGVDPDRLHQISSKNNINAVNDMYYHVQVYLDEGMPAHVLIEDMQLRLRMIIDGIRAVSFSVEDFRLFKELLIEHPSKPIRKSLRLIHCQSQLTPGQKEG